MVLIALPRRCRRFPWLMKTEIPPIMQYPVDRRSYLFATSRIRMFYAPSLAGSVGGLMSLLGCFLPGGGGSKPKPKLK